MNVLISFLGLGCLGIFLLVFGGGGIYMIVSSRKASAQAQDSQSWLSTTATITRSEVGRSESSSSDGTRFSYHPVVEYTYQVGGQGFAGQRIAFGPVKGSPRFVGAQAGLAKYPLGGVATVYYNPQNPAEAVLEKQATGTKSMLVLGFVFLAVAACLFLPGVVLTVVGILSRLPGR